MKNKIEDLRNHLFDALEGLADKDKPMELDRARAIADVARVIVDSAKAEVEFVKVTGRREGTGFIPLPASETVPTNRRLSAGARTVRPIAGASTFGGRSCTQVGCNGRLDPSTDRNGYSIDECSKCGATYPMSDGATNGASAGSSSNGSGSNGRA